jgi:Tfp pilus assembly protein PilV
MKKCGVKIRFRPDLAPIPVRRRSTEAGFGLIDSMISIVVISVSTVGFLAASVTSMSLEKESRTVAAANEMSRAVVEEMLALPIEQVLPTYNANKADDPNGAGTACGDSWTIDTTTVLLATADDTLALSAYRLDNSGSGSLSSGSSGSGSSGSGSSGSGSSGSGSSGSGSVVGGTTSVLQSVVGTVSATAITDAEAFEVPKTMDCSIGLPTTLDAAGNETLREDIVAPEYGLPCDLNGDGVIDGLNHAADYKILPLVIRLDWPIAGGGTRTVTFAAVLGGGKAP